MLSSEFQEAFRDSAQDLLARHDHFKRCRQRAQQPAVDRALWKELAEAGWFSVLAPEDDGGLGRGLSDLAVIAQQAGQQLLTEPYLVGAVQVLQTLMQVPSSAMRDVLLHAAMAGDLVAGLGWQGEVGQLDVDLNSIAVVARPQGPGWSLQGRLRLVTPVHDVDGWLVVARSLDQQPMLFWLKNDATVKVDVYPLVDGALVGDVQLQTVGLDAACLLAQGPEVLAAVNRANDMTRMMVAAELVGVMEGALKMTLDYMKVRHQFGQPIASFQALKHRAVHLWVELQIAQAALREALAWADSDQSHDLARQASRVKARCSQAALTLTRQCIQLHGAIGFTDEYDVGLYFKRAMVLSAWLGNAAVHRTRYLSLSRGQTVAAEQDHDVEPPADQNWDGMSDQAFRQMLRTFYRRHYPDHLRNIQRRLTWDEIRDWTLTLSRQGWIAPGWPKAFGGMGLSPEKLLAYVEEQENYGVARGIDQGIVMVGPLLIQYGTPEQQAEFLPKILSAEHRWCQGYSEPNAGSDLASLKTSAVLDGDEFVVNGQKIWTTMAHSSNYIFTLVRTDLQAKPQAGISFLLIDLTSPGITVRPIKDIAGHVEFCEVFFDNVRVPARHLVGEINQGWTMAKALLGFERIFLGSPKQSRYALSQLNRLADERQLFDDPVFAAKYAELLLDVEDLSAAYAEFAELVKRGEPMPPSVSLLKVWATQTYQRICQVLMEAAQDSAAVDAAYDSATASLNPPAILLNSVPATIYGGTTEVQCEILARAVLGIA